MSLFFFFFNCDFTVQRKKIFRRQQQQQQKLYFFLGGQSFVAIRLLFVWFDLAAFYLFFEKAVCVFFLLKPERGKKKGEMAFFVREVFSFCFGCFFLFMILCFYPI